MKKKPSTKTDPRQEQLELYTTSKLNDLIQQGTSPSTLRAYRQDQIRFWAYTQKQFGLDEHYPVDIKIIMAFVLDHMEGNHVQKLKISTIKRYISSVGIVHQEKGYPSPALHPQVKLLVKRARRAYKNQQPVQKVAATKSIVQKLIDTCDHTLHGIRDKALILVGFGAGGRRREELANLDVSDIKALANGNYMLCIRASKTDQEAEGREVPVTGSAARALKCWLAKSGITHGRVFRGIKRNDELLPSITGRTICRVVQKAAEDAGFDPSEFGAHSLRAGFMTEAVKHKVPLLEAMELSGHKTLAVAQRYYRSADLENNRAANLLDNQIDIEE